MAWNLQNTLPALPTSQVSLRLQQEPIRVNSCNSCLRPRRDAGAPRQVWSGQKNRRRRPPAYSRAASPTSAQLFASRALELRYPDPARDPIRAEQLLEVRRHEDAGNNLWAIRNRVQEALLRGGMRAGSRTNPAGKPFHPMRIA